MNRAGPGPPGQSKIKVGISMEIKDRYTLKDKLKAMGPGILVVGSFIGPGTVTSATKSGCGLWLCVAVDGGILRHRCHCHAGDGRPAGHRDSEWPG